MSYVSKCIVDECLNWCSIALAGGAWMGLWGFTFGRE